MSSHTKIAPGSLWSHFCGAGLPSAQPTNKIHCVQAVSGLTYHFGSKIAVGYFIQPTPHARSLPAMFRVKATGIGRPETEPAAHRLR
jgi:hypothetical protein